MKHYENMKIPTAVKGNNAIENDVFRYETSSMDDDEQANGQRLKSTLHSLQYNQRSALTCVALILAAPLMFQIVMWTSMLPIIKSFNKEILCFMILVLSQLLTYLAYLVFSMYRDYDALGNLNISRRDGRISRLKYRGRELFNFMLISSFSALVLCIGLLHFGYRSWANSILIGAIVLILLFQENNCTFIDSNSDHALDLEKAAFFNRRHWDSAIHGSLERKSRGQRVIGRFRSMEWPGAEKISSETFWNQQQNYRQKIVHCTRSSSTPPGFATIEESE